MDILKVHSNGEVDYLKILQEKFEELKQKIFSDKSLTSIEKKKELKELKKSFQEKQQNSNRNLY